MAMKKKTLIMASLVVLLVITGYLNYQYNISQGSDSMKSADLLNSQKATDIKVTDTSKASDKNVTTNTTKTSTSSNYFIDFRKERDQVRNDEISYLNSIADNKATDSTTLKQAQQQKIEITKSMEKEVTIEGLVKAKGFSDVIVTLHSGSVNVIVNQAEITEAQAVQILDITKRESGEKPENIKIIPAN